ncbi:MAG: T9SS type A sorting domain-containing protein [Bacteroidota bacterium]
MKRLLFFIFLVVTALIFTVPTNVSAQTPDTVYIPGAQSLNISHIINADTSLTRHRVYKLDRGAIYYIVKAFEITSSRTFVATGDPTKRPPVLAPAILADNSSEEWFFKLTKPGIKVELNDLYLLSMRSDKKTLGWSRAIHIGANNVSLKMRRVVLDGFTEAGIRVDGSDFYKLDVQDCHFRNFIHSTSYFGGQPYLSGFMDHPESVVFINNTFFACNSYIFSIRGYDKNSVFKHNTLVYGVVNPFLTDRASNLHINDNLFYAVHAWGGDPEQINGSWLGNYPDTTASSILHIRVGGRYHNKWDVAGPEQYTDAANGITADLFAPNKRVVKAIGNAIFYPTKLLDYYTKWNDTVKVKDSVAMISGGKQFVTRKLPFAYWLNDVRKGVIDSLTKSKSTKYTPFATFANNIENQDPGFTSTSVVAHLDNLIAYVNRIATRKLDNPWHYELNFPPKWPVPENLAYSNTALQNAASDGFAVGDLNWFPSQKQQWLLTDVRSEKPIIPTEFILEQNYPNPFNPTTTIKFSVPKTGYYTLRVFNVLGQEVAKLLNGQLNPGLHEAVFDASNFGSGVYFYNLSGSDINITKKMMLLK